MPSVSITWSETNYDDFVDGWPQFLPDTSRPIISPPTGQILLNTASWRQLSTETPASSCGWDQSSSTPCNLHDDMTNAWTGTNPYRFTPTIFEDKIDYYIGESHVLWLEADHTAFVPGSGSSIDQIDFEVTGSSDNSTGEPWTEVRAAFAFFDGTAVQFFPFVIYCGVRVFPPYIYTQDNKYRIVNNGDGTFTMKRWTGSVYADQYTLTSSKITDSVINGSGSRKFGVVIATESAGNITGSTPPGYVDVSISSWTVTYTAGAAPASGTLIRTI